MVGIISSMKSVITTVVLSVFVFPLAPAKASLGSPADLENPRVVPIFG
jgi:hypothetical protein